MCIDVYRKGEEMSKAKFTPRVCVHCLKPKCRCTFKIPKDRMYSTTISNQSSDVTVGEVKKTISEYFFNDDRLCTFTITVHLRNAAIGRG